MISRVAVARYLKEHPDELYIKLSNLGIDIRTTRMNKDEQIDRIWNEYKYRMAKKSVSDNNGENMQNIRDRQVIQELITMYENNPSLKKKCNDQVEQITLNETINRWKNSGQHFNIDINSDRNKCLITKIIETPDVINSLPVKTESPWKVSGNLDVIDVDNEPIIIDVDAPSPVNSPIIIESQNLLPNVFDSAEPENNDNDPIMDFEPAVPENNPPSESRPKRKNKQQSLGVSSHPRKKSKKNKRTTATEPNYSQFLPDEIITFTIKEKFNKAFASNSQN